MKRHPSDKEIRKAIAAGYQAGRSSAEIAFDMSNELDLSEKDAAFFVAAFPRPELKRKYGFANTVLFLCIIVIAGLRSVTLLSQEPPVPLRSFLTGVIALAFAYGIANYRGSWYKALPLVCFAWLTKDIPSALNASFLLRLQTVLEIIALGFGFVLSIRLFPKLGLLSAKKTADGKYDL